MAVLGWLERRAERAERAMTDAATRAFTRDLTTAEDDDEQSRPRAAA